MCDGATGSRRAHPLPRPRWGPLYGLLTLAGVALLATEFGLTPGPARTVLEVGVVCVAFAALGAGVRCQRVAFDLQNWCDCASDRITIRIVLSRAPAVAGDVWPDERSVAPDDPFDDEEDPRLVPAGPGTRRTARSLGVLSSCRTREPPSKTR